jgi:uncharacterized membrane protein
MRTLHILAGTLVLLSGFLALYSPKGGDLHRLAGRVFVVAMLLMASLGSLMAVVHITDRGTALIGMLCCYLVTTGYLAVARNELSRAALPALAVAAAAIGLAGLGLGASALATDGKIDHLPAAPVLVFAVFALLGSLGDARLLLRGTLDGRARLFRHLWRMGLALWIATSSFFLGQAKFLPSGLREHGLHGVPVLAVLLTLLYWLFRMRGRARRRAEAA